MRRVLSLLLVFFFIAESCLGASAFIGGRPRTVLDWEAATSMTPERSQNKTSAFDRNSAQTFLDHDGQLHRITTNDIPAFTGARMLRNLLATSSTPATQNVTLGIGTYMLQAAAGSATSSALTATITGGGAATAGTPNIFTVTSYGTVTITVASMPAGTGFILHNITGESDQTTEREFIHSDVTYDGLGVAGVRYYSTAVDGTALTGIKGYAYNGGATTNKIAGAYNALGPDMLGTELITNGTFDSDSSWTKGTGWSIGSGVASSDGSQVANSDLRPNPLSTKTVGKVYRWSITVTRSAGTLSFFLDGIGSVSINSSGTYTADEVCNNGADIYIRADANFVGTVDNVSVKEIGAANLAGTFYSGGGTSASASYATSWSNPLPGITCSGGTDGESSLTIVSDTAKLASATPKLTRIIPSGKVYKAVAGATASMDITFTGNLSAATHTIQVYARGDSAADDAIALGDAVGGIGSAQALTNEYRLISRKYTAGASGTVFRIAAGDTVYFCLMHSDALTVPVYPVLVEGAAASVVRTDGTIPVADGVNFSQAAGTVTVEWTAGFDSSSMANPTTVTILVATNTTVGHIYITRDATTLTARTYDGTNVKGVVIPEFSKGDTITFKSTWSKARNKLNVYASTAAGTGWGTAAAYDGAFALGSYWYIGYGSAYPFSIKNIVVTNTFDKAGL